MSPAPDPTPSVLVLGDESNVLLAIARSLGRRGVAVHVGSCPAEAPVLHSRYVAQFHQLPVQSDSEAWLEAVLAVLRSHQFDLVIPASENAAFLVQTARAKFTAHPEVYLLNERAFDVVFDKHRTTTLATLLDIPTPTSRIVRNRAELEDALGGATLPVVVKPICSVRLSDPNTKNFVRRIDARQDVAPTVDALAAQGDEWLVQEFFEGRGVGVEVLADHGEVLFAFQHARLHETTGYGSTLRESAAVDPALRNAVERLLRALDYTGVAMVEFRVSPTGERFVLLEVNGRFWGSLPLAVAAGADFPYYLLQLLVRGVRRFDPQFRVGVRSRHLPEDLRWLWRSAMRKTVEIEPAVEGSLGWTINRIPRAQLRKDILAALAFQDHIDSFALDDLRPGFVETFRLLQFATRWATRRTSQAA